MCIRDRYTNSKKKVGRRSVSRKRNLSQRGTRGGLIAKISDCGNWKLEKTSFAVDRVDDE